MKKNSFLLIVFLNISLVAQNRATKLTGFEISYPFWFSNEEKVIFQSNWFTSSDLFVMNSDGSSVKQLTSTQFNEITPTVSPNGKYVAFVSDETGTNEIFIMDIDGSNKKQITFNKSENIHPNWHPKENKLIFSSTVQTPEIYQIYEVDIDSKKTKRILTSTFSDTYASWSPDGSKIAYTKWASNNDVYFMDYHTGKEYKATSNKSFDGWPIWDGNDEIVFASYRERPAEIFKINIVSKNVRQITNSDHRSIQPNIRNGKMVYTTRSNRDYSFHYKQLEYNLLTFNKRQLYDFSRVPAKKETASFYRILTKNEHKDNSIIQKDFYLNDQPKMLVWCRKDNISKYDGRFTSWYENGNLDSEGNYANGQRIGKWEFYRENGKKSATRIYKRGRIVSSQFWDENGKEIFPDERRVHHPARFGKSRRDASRYLSRNLRYPKTALKNKIEGSVFVYVKVNKKGQVEDVIVKKGLSKETDLEAVRLVKSMPSWIPAKNHNRAYDYTIGFNVRFILPASNR